MSKQSELNALYRQVRGNYLRNIRSMENRGYVFDKNPRPSIPKRITEGSIRRLQRLNEKRYNRAYLVDPNTGEVLGKGRRAQNIERSLVARRAAQTRRANEGRMNIDQLGGALIYETEQATPGGSTESFFADLRADIEGVARRAEVDDDFAIYAGGYLDERWEDIQRALEYISVYGNIEAAPDRLVDWLVMHVRELQGRNVTQEDMQRVGMLSDEPDYYPTE